MTAITKVFEGRNNKSGCNYAEVVVLNVVMEVSLEHLDRAIAHFGSQAKLGRAVGLSQAAIYKMRAERRMPAEIAKAIDEASAGSVSKSDLRPDLWPIPASTEGRAA